MSGPVRTGFERQLDEGGAAVAHELTRMGAALLQELTSAPTPGNETVRTVAVVRNRKSTAAKTSTGVDATWAPVEGLDAISAIVHTPTSWKPKNDQPALREGERIFILVDVPEDPALGADKVLLTDRIRHEDATYGLHDFAVLEVAPDPGTGLVWVKAAYARTN